MNDASLTSGEAAVLTFAFSEAVSGFDAADISLADTRGSISNFVAVDAKTYRATFTPTSNVESSTNTISVAQGTYTDTAGNAGTAARSGNFVIDTKAPTVTITASDVALITGDSSIVTFSFSEAVNGFDLSDVNLSNAVGTLSQFVSVDAQTYRATLTPIVGIEVASSTLGIIQGSYTDNLGNLGIGGTSASFAVDTKAPTLTITLSSTTLTAGQTATVTFTFSENVTGFNLADVSLADANGSLTAFTSINAATYQATFTPLDSLADAANTMNVAIGAYSDMMGNSGQGATSPSYAINTVVGGKTIYGLAGSDTVTGTDYNDIIYGVPATGSSPGRGTIDTLYGGKGADIFMLGDGRGYFYDDGNAKNVGKGDYAILADFVSGEDKISVGAPYSTSAITISGTKGVGIYGDSNGNGRYDATSDELIGFVPNYSFLPVTDFI